MSEKVAIFLDVENLSGWLKADGGETLLERANELGRVVVRRAYGDFSILSVSVRQPELNLLGFEFVHVYHPVKGKNSADIQIVVDVMEYLARIPDLEWVVLATGDSDFSPLFRRLRELGKSVMGVGPRSALSEAVKRTCNRFIYIDEEPVSDGAVASLKTAQLREDALELLEQVLDKFPDGANLSTLKNKMLETDSAFDENNLGFDGFMKFLQSAPEIVTLYKVKEIWNAKALETGEKQNEVLSCDSQSGSTLVEPTIDLYRRFLRKSGWRSYKSSCLWDALTGLKTRFPEGFTKGEEFEYLIESFGRNLTRGELRSMIYIFYKAGFVVQQQQKRNDESILTVDLPKSERVMSKKLDLVMVNRIVQICRLQEVSFIPELIPQLLINSYTQEQFNVLVINAQDQ
ncbi:NYN domain-containing protein [Leptolyngbya sp. FACHB-36]|uniref:NYN domain-containing protein n=1 Tax=Leptolyngbya sp. FACHB-36 TaxID=2692808 RepID=UPI00168003E0|nr:NYN domain-containing protein [Leptolyngbya sp. FACHB-36]MBD2020262.1 NYN domain-containing protein [Leptolyngbya sp. FACHB-36]